MRTQEPKPRTWRSKFADALRGVSAGIRGERSFLVHLPAALAVVVAAWLLELDRLEWGLLVLCVTVVLVAEMFNSALECLGKAIEPHPNPLLGRALDMASGAVLLAAIGAAAVGAVVLVPHLF
jgi:diacylglycerol kinase